MSGSKVYKVAEHLFEVRLDVGNIIWERMEEYYGPFEMREDHAALSKLFYLSIKMQLDTILSLLIRDQK